MRVGDVQPGTACVDILDAIFQRVAIDFERDVLRTVGNVDDVVIGGIHQKYAARFYQPGSAPLFELHGLMNGKQKYKVLGPVYFCRNFDNNISKLLANVVEAFSTKERLPGWAWSAEEKQWR
jgi:hypothetical protein